mgnify:CR=1 FL=1
MELHFKFIGILLMLLGVLHIGFPKYFNWKQELSSLSLINKQMMTIHTFFIALTVFMMGLLCLTSAADLIQTNLGQKISLGLGIFWSIRLIIQLFGYSSALWKGKTFETAMHIVFTLLWLYLSYVFLSSGRNYKF